MSRWLVGSSSTSTLTPFDRRASPAPPGALAAGQLADRLIRRCRPCRPKRPSRSRIFCSVCVRVVVRPDGADHRLVVGSALAGAGRSSRTRPGARAAPCPRSGSSSPSRICSSVVLPQPLGPMMPRRLPRGRSKLRFSNSSRSPNALHRSSTWKTMSPRARDLAEVHVRRRRPCVGRLDPLDLVERLRPRLRLLGQLAVVHAADVLFLLLDVLLLRLARLQLPARSVPRAAAQYCVEVAGVAS